MIPMEKLSLLSGGETPAFTQYINSKAWASSLGDKSFVVGVAEDGHAKLMHRNALSIALGTNNIERMRVSSSGTIDFYGTIQSVGYKIDTTGVFQSKGYRTMANNVNYHHFTANHESNAAVFINQVTTTAPILRLSNGTATFNSGVKFSFEGNGNLGIGTTTVAEKLVLYTGAASPVYTQYGNTKSTIGATDKSFIVGVDGEGNAKVQHRGAFSLAFGTNNTERMRILSNGNIGIGTASPDHKLDVVGTIRAHSVQVATTKTADFVFEENYALMPLSEVEKFVTTNKHLPEVAPATEMLENGINMGDMQIKLLQKVEELTLYVIQQQKKMDQQQKEIEELKKELRNKK